jgi:alpha-L-rhamnosidase
MTINVPVGSTATVYVPAANSQAVTESGTTADDADGVRYMHRDDGYAVFTVDSGEYCFQTK